jgi:hypothetical protein
MLPVSKLYSAEFPTLPSLNTESFIKNLKKKDELERIRNGAITAQL